MNLKLNIKKIRAEMKRLEINQSELARRMGSKRQWVSFVLRHGQPVTAAVKIAKVFNLRPKDLIL